MPKITFKMIVVERDPMTKIPKQAAPWEVPVYRSLYGDEKVEILGENQDREVEIAELPDAGEEYLRMRDVFGIEPDTKQSHVDIVYGRGAQAIKPLEAAIKASVAGDIEKAQAVVDKERGGVDNDTLARRKEQYADDDNGIDEFATQKAVRVAGDTVQRGLASEVAKAADEAEANREKSTQEIVTAAAEGAATSTARALKGGAAKK